MTATQPLLLFAVEDAFQITGRGCVIVPGFFSEVGGVVLRAGDPIRLVHPDGRAVDTTVQGIEMLGRGARPGRNTVPVLLAREITKEQVPVGTQVFALQPTYASKRGDGDAI